ncbi:hypothetical protein MKS88_001420 [Plasmodium brasilianum]|uniref:Uncharacterized protein n=1 Tax=Plasmodium brasilianum TaxID=5824 RepID=A0ACB9YD84_PLABR|nr:hypothetical protein MKS88_001420 [Plasmodium brasilianum]
MRTVLFNGPYIPDFDAGYNVQVNGLSVNFLKDPFCFRNNVVESMYYKQREQNNTINMGGENKKELNPTASTKFVEIPRYTYEERITNINDTIIHKNTFVPCKEPIYYYNEREEKVPIYEAKQIKYSPKSVEGGGKLV